MHKGECQCADICGKKCIHFENTLRCNPTSHIPGFLLWQAHRQLAEVNGMSHLFLTSWPWPLTYILDLRTWPTYPSTWPSCQKSSPYVCMFGRESETDTHTHAQTDNAKTITPITSETWGVMKTVLAYPVIGLRRTLSCLDASSIFSLSFLFFLEVFLECDLSLFLSIAH